MSAQPDTRGEWAWVGAEAAARLRRTGAVVAAVDLVVAAVTLALLLTSWASMPPTNPFTAIFLIIGLLAPVALGINAAGGLLLRRHVREGFVDLGGVTRVRAGAVGSVLLAVLAFGGTALLGGFGTTLPALVVVALATGVVLAATRHRP